MIDTDNMTNEEAGMSWIDDNLIEEARKVLEQAIGTPEVLFDDPSPELYDDMDCESDLNALIEVQERMAKGMSIIQDMTSRRDKALHTYITEKHRFSVWMERLERGEARWVTLTGEEKTEKRAVYKAWKHNIWTHARPIKDKRDAAYKEYMAHKEYMGTPRMKDYLDRLWTRWFELKDECTHIAETAEAGRGKVWYEYFNLVNDEDYLNNTGFDCEEIDNLEILFSETEHVDCIRDAHFSEEFSAPVYDGDEGKVEDMPVRTWGYVPRCKDVTKAWSRLHDSATHTHKAEESLENVCNPV